MYKFPYLLTVMMFAVDRSGSVADDT